MQVVRRSDRAPDCCLCRAAIDEAAAACPGCGASYHAACLLELNGGRCSTLGCAAQVHAPGHVPSLEPRDPDVEEEPPLGCVSLVALLGAFGLTLVEALGPRYGKARVGGTLVLVALIAWLAWARWPTSPGPHDKDPS